MIIESAYSGIFDVEYTAWAAEKTDSSSDGGGFCASAILMPVGLVGLVALAVIRK